MWYECPDFDDESIRVAKDLRETVVDKYREIIDDFNQDSVYMEISILSDKTEKEGYDNMFDTNVSFMIVSICIMIVFVIGANYKNILIASLSMVLTFMCIIAVFGFTIQPYTPSMIQVKQKPFRLLFATKKSNLWERQYLHFVFAPSTVLIRFNQKNLC